EDQSGSEEEREPGELRPGTAVRHSTLERLLDRSHAVDEDVPEEEDQDPRSERAQCGAEASAGRLHAAERQAEENGESGDRTEGGDLGRAHRVWDSFGGVVRVTLQRPSATIVASPPSSKQ